MINVVVCYDDNDSELEDYFENSFNDIKTLLDPIENIAIQSIRSLDCNETNVETACSTLNIPFIFIGLSHGNKSELLTDNDVYVQSENISHFANSLFYSPACSTAIDLGKRLIENGCLCYVGCIKDTDATFEDFYATYIECENYCIKEFLSSDKTIETAFHDMLEFFDLQIDSLWEKDEEDVLLAMELQNNKDSFVLYGDKNLTKSTFDLP